MAPNPETELVMEFLVHVQSTDSEKISATLDAFVMCNVQDNRLVDTMFSAFVMANLFVTMVVFRIRKWNTCAQLMIPLKYDPIILRTIYLAH
jgi:hypothetical protein